MKFKEKINDLDDKFEFAFYQVDATTKNLFIEKVMKEDKISREEALELIETNPMYSMGLKTCIYKNRCKLDLRTSRKEKKKKFLESLTPEELRLYNEGPGKGYWAIRKAEKEAEKKLKIQAEELKRKIDNGEKIDENDIPEELRYVMKNMQSDDHEDH